MDDYVNNISDAFEVVEKLRKDWIALDEHETKYFEIIDCCEYGWRVDINWGHHDGNVNLHRSINESLSRAICEAVIKAYGVEK